MGIEFDENAMAEMRTPWLIRSATIGGIRRVTMRMMGRRWTGKVMQSVMLTSDGSGLHAGMSDDIWAVKGSS